MSKPSSSQRVYYLIHFPLICLPGVFFTTISHTTWINFETRCSSPRGFELSCRCTNHCFSTLARSNTRNGSTDTLQEAHPFVLVPHHPCSKTPDMIIDYHKPPLSLYVEWKAWIPPFASASFLQTYHLSPLISYSGPTLDQLGNHARRRFRRTFSPPAWFAQFKPYYTWHVHLL